MAEEINRRQFISLSVAAALCAKTRLAGAEVTDNIAAVDPLIGASTSAALGEGKTFPGATTPFGMVQLSPDTVTGDDNASGYSYEHTTMEGFSYMRMSGVGWYGDFGNLLTMPTTGDLQVVPGRPDNPGEGWRSPYKHSTEVAQCGYYAVTLERYGIRAELTAAPYSGFMRYTFPQSGNARIQIDLARRIGGISTRQYVKIVDAHTIEGWVECPERGGGWGNGKGHVSYILYFRSEFSKPIVRSGVWSIDLPPLFLKPGLEPGDDLIADRFQSEAFYQAASRARVTRDIVEKEGEYLGFFVEYDTSPDEQILVKTGFSFVDQEGARQNLRHDIPHWDFNRTRSQAREQWSQAIDQIEIDGVTESQRTIFATALYHAMIDPRKISDHDGRYRAANHEIRKQGASTRRTIFSGWDVFRAEMPLLTILNPAIVNDQICSLVDLAAESGKGYLERWEIMNAYSGCMDGDPALAVILDAYEKGIRKFDIEKAYAACRQSAAGIGKATGRPENEFYLGNGYVPEQVSWTLDNAYFDWCVGRFAHRLGKTEDAETFLHRALNYSKIYDPGVKSMRARHRDGSWMEWKGELEFGQGCTESNPLQQSWFVPHDVYGLISLMGRDVFADKLEQLFENTPKSFAWNPYYNHSNEPVHHLAYLFTYVGKPWLTQKWVRRILDQAYAAKVNGICGNDDVGQMSAWYVLSALGFYPVCPGSNVYILGSPLFRRAAIRLDPAWHSGSRFTVVAEGNSPANCYIQSARLNGKELHRAWITHEEIVSGSTLEFTMGPSPNTEWGTRPGSLPPDVAKGENSRV
ncbi:MAG TPA: GH92 family glycosyl hydrolase [Alloacidobacterium sp.]|nr:GH92 family glycosyl hydrolase [Alloacidobacterium sp.]